MFQEIISLRRSFGNGIVAVLPGKFFEESPESYLPRSRGAVWGYFGYRSDITEPLGFVQDACDVMVLFGESMVFVRWTSSL